ALNEGDYKGAACKPAVQAAELIDSSFDPLEYRDWLLGENGNSNTNPGRADSEANISRHIYDTQGLLSKEDAERLEQLFAEKSEEIGVDIIFYTSSLFSDNGDAAATHLGGVCKAQGYGYGDERYVVMFGISTENRYAMIYEWSSDIKKYHRYLQVELDDIFDSVKSYLSSGMNNRYGARESSQRSFASGAEKFLELAVEHSDKDDAPYEAFYYSDNYERYDLNGHKKVNWGRFGVFGLIGAAISGIITAFTAAKHKPKTVTDPEVYSNRNEFAILESSDNFRVRTTTRVRMSSSSGGGGGGHSHGGGGGGGGHGSGGHF
ncbi:MAG: TPM domain-containing protein, partial [Lachnospiraceae bacterium]|nr:TPM domain-containing protein [Lachnospiraceae bacterium]